MKSIISLSILISLFTACSSTKNIAQQDQEKKDITFYLQDLNSLGHDTTDYVFLFNEGFRTIYYGENDRGNALMSYALSLSDSIRNHDYQLWSSKNTKNGNYAIAIDKLEKSIQIKPQEESAYYGWVLLYYYRDYKKALRILELQDEYTPNFSDAPVGEDIHYLKGLCHMQLQHYQIAIDEFNTYINNLAITHGEDFVDVYTFVQKGRCLSKLGKFEEAIQSYQKAIKYYQDCTEAYYFTGLTQIKMRQKSKACNNFNTALEMINKGEKSTNLYVELFHEIYPQQIEQSIKEFCK